MSISFQVLGAPGADNAVFAQVDTGQQVSRLLFDCGEGCLSALSFADLQAIDHLFFSHLHMDHVAGFDTFFRANFDRVTRPNQIWGPPETARILQHRFQGYTWNLHGSMDAAWRVHDLHPGHVGTARFELREAFSQWHDEGERPHAGMILDGSGFTVEMLTMDHRTPTIAYIVREKQRLNLDTSRMASLGLKPGPWVRLLKEAATDTGVMVVDGKSFQVGDLRERLYVTTPGESLAYLTDFLLDEAAIGDLAPRLLRVTSIVCEGQYRHEDEALARKHHHMTTRLSALLAREARAGSLVLFHLSCRYQPTGWLEMLAEARAIFPKTRFPDHWNMA